MLGAPFLCRDKKPLKAVYGPDLDFARHTAWLDALRGGGDLGPLGQYMVVGGVLVSGTGRAPVTSLRALARRWSWPSVLSFAAGRLALGGLILDSSTRSRLRQKFGPPLWSATELVVGLIDAYRHAEDEFRKLSAPAPISDDLLATLPPGPALGRLCLYTPRPLARRHSGRSHAARTTIDGVHSFRRTCELSPSNFAPHPASSRSATHFRSDKHWSDTSMPATPPKARRR